MRHTINAHNEITLSQLQGRNGKFSVTLGHVIGTTSISVTDAEGVGRLLIAPQRMSYKQRNLIIFFHQY